jgi:hypothetical protein
VAVGARVLDLAARADVDRLQLELRLDEQEQRPAESGTMRRQDERERDEREVADDEVEASERQLRSLRGGAR